MTVYGPAPGSGPGLLFEMDATETEADRRAREPDLADRCDDPTPRGVIRAALEAAICHDIEDGPIIGCDPDDMYGDHETGYPLKLGFSREPLRVLDVGAGYGAWSSEMRRLANRQGWPVHITGVEILDARRKHMRKWCDVSTIGHWSNELAAMEEAVDAHGFDIAIGNPPFDELTGPKGAKRPPEQCMPAVLLRHAPAVLLLHTQQAFLKSEAGRASWRANPPAASWLVPGGLKFRGPTAINPRTGKVYGADSTCYQFTLWLRDHTGPCSVYMLDDRPPSARSWTVPPGTEEPSKCQSCDGHPEAGPLPWDPACRTGGCTDCYGSGLDPNGDLPSAPGHSP